MVRVGSGFSRRYLARRAGEAMVDLVTIYRPSDPSLNPSTGMMTAGELLKVYQGRARIYSLTGPSVIMVGEADLATRNTYVSIPADSEMVPHRDDVVVVDEAISDEDLQGRAFRVLDVSGGGLVRAVRRMLCVSFEESSAWGQ